MNVNEIKKQIIFHKLEAIKHKKIIDEHKQKIKELKILSNKYEILNYVDEDIYVYIFSDNEENQKLINFVKEKYHCEDLNIDYYVLETNYGSDKLYMREIFNDETSEMKKYLNNKQKEKIKLCNIDKQPELCFEKRSSVNFEVEQFLKYLTTLNTKKIFRKEYSDMNYNNNFSYNTLHKINLPIVHIKKLKDQSQQIQKEKKNNKKCNEKHEDDKNIITIRVLSFINDKNFCKLDMDICNG